MKIIIYLISSILTVITLFYFLGSAENGYIYLLASKIIGHLPESGYGAFQYPLGAIILIFSGFLIGSGIGFLINKYFVEYAPKV